MIYVDTSVVLAHVLAQDEQVFNKIWEYDLVSSRLLQYESWNRIHALGYAKEAGDELRQCLGRIAFIELATPALERALHPFPVPVRTLDGLHLSTLEFLKSQGHEIVLATLDKKMLQAAKKMKIEIFELS